MFSYFLYLFIWFNLLVVFLLLSFIFCVQETFGAAYFQENADKYTQKIFYIFCSVWGKKVV